MSSLQTAEHKRLADSEARRADWKNWGPYVSDRAWATVREDYSATGEAWEYFPHDHARSRAYRWNEDGLGGFCNRFQNICLAVALWNEKDPILKERFFGLTGNEGNHGEDVKEYYFYLDGIPSHSYMKMLYKYPQAEYPYTELVEKNRKRSQKEPEYELIDALRDTFEENRYFDVFIEYAKAGQEDILCRITAHNRGPDPAPLHILPHLWYRNTWSWGHNNARPTIWSSGRNAAYTEHRHLKVRYWYVDGEDIQPELLFTENDTNFKRLYNTDNATANVKDSINDAVVDGHTERVNSAKFGTKVAAHFQKVLQPGESVTIKVRFVPDARDTPFDDFDSVFEQRIQEADAFYDALHPDHLTDDEKLVQRQAFAGLLWTKQFYHFSVELWREGDPEQPLPPPRRNRNEGWNHLYALDVFSMPDKWEYPWFAAWDLAFHTLPIAAIDMEWAKRQLILLLREWYMHPNGQIPAYEWNFDDVNPPVHAWATLQVYRMDYARAGTKDTLFLERVFQKLLMNFTWWVNREDRDGNNIFEGGFLGLDNIGIFDRSAPLPTGGYIEQADGTAWMAMYCLNMLEMALELARTNPAYEDVATKFFEHFVYIANAFYGGGEHASLWDEVDGFFYDSLHLPDGSHTLLKTRSFVGLIPLLAVTALDPQQLKDLPHFRRRMNWFIKYRPHLIKRLRTLEEVGEGGNYQLSIVGREKLERILQHMFNPDEFLSDYGLRSLSRYHLEHPYEFDANNNRYMVKYEPAESTSRLFGGNSNWRGPIWLPINYILIDALRAYHQHYGDTLTVELPTGSGNRVTLDKAADELSKRLTKLFLRDESGERPTLGYEALFQNDPKWRDYVLFYEYFHGDNGAGLGASHQTGWTALVANLLLNNKPSI